MKLEGRSILITGGTSGIGQALVEQLAAANDSIAVIARNADRLASIARRFANVSTYPCSLTDKNAMDGTLAKILDRHRDLSVVINNAGIQYTPTLTDPEFSFDSIEQEVATNLTAPIRICALTLRHMLGLKIPSAYINVTSGLALFPKRSSAVYCATKAGLHNFSTSFRYQLEGTHVSVFEVVMPLVDTPMTEGRGRGKIPAAQAAHALIRGVERGKTTIYVGKSKLIPIVARLSPTLMSNIMKSG
jgi:uncharacterized oxidoreductase